MNIRAAVARLSTRINLPRSVGVPFSSFAAKQALAKPSRYYGDGGTIHGTNHVDVCVDKHGNVVQVWFRCQVLPFEVSAASTREYLNPADVLITGVEVLDL